MGTVVASRDGGRGVRIGAVEKRQKRVPLDPLRHEIDAAPIVLVHRAERCMLRIPPAGGRRKRMLASDRSVKLAADRENRVADFFRTQAPASESRVDFSRRLLDCTSSGLSRCSSKIADKSRSESRRRCMAFTDHPLLDEWLAR